MSIKISVNLPSVHPHLNQTFGLVYPDYIQLQSSDKQEEAQVSTFVISVADLNNLINVDVAGMVFLGMQEYASQYMQNGTVLVIDAATEGWPFFEAAFHSFHTLLEKFGISPTCVLLMTTNYLFTDDYRAWCVSSGYDPVSVYVFDFWCYRSSIQLRSEVLNDETVTQQLFDDNFDVNKYLISFNRIFKAHRAAIPMFLIKSGIIENSLVSFMPDSKSLSEKQKQEMLDYMLRMGWPTLTELCSEWTTLSALVPKVVDLDQSTEYLTFVINKIISADYKSVGLAVITESDFGVSGVDRVTEKPFKSIANCCPFILVGQPNQLSRLDKLGFIRYPLINNEYDQVDSPDARLKLLFAELSRIGQLSMTELSNFRKKSHEISVVNFKHLLNFSSDDNLERLAASFMSAIQETANRRSGTYSINA